MILLPSEELVRDDIVVYLRRREPDVHRQRSGKALNHNKACQERVAMF